MSRCRSEINGCTFKLRQDTQERIKAQMHTSIKSRWRFLHTCGALCTWWWRRRGRATWPPCRHTRPGAKTPQGMGGKTAPSSDPEAGKKREKKWRSDRSHHKYSIQKTKKQKLKIKNKSQACTATPWWALYMHKHSTLRWRDMQPKYKWTSRKRLWVRTRSKSAWKSNNLVEGTFFFQHLHFAFQAFSCHLAGATECNNSISFPVCQHKDPNKNG